MTRKEVTQVSKTYKVTLVERVQQTWEIQADDEEHALRMLMETNLGEPDRDDTDTLDMIVEEQAC